MGSLSSTVASRTPMTPVEEARQGLGRGVGIGRSNGAASLPGRPWAAARAVRSRRRGGTKARRVVVPGHWARVYPHDRASDSRPEMARRRLILHSGEPERSDRERRRLAPVPRQAACSIGSRAGERGGGRAGSPECSRIRSMTAGSRMAAMIFNSPPQFGQCCMSISNTRLSSSAQLMRDAQRCPWNCPAVAGMRYSRSDLRSSWSGAAGLDSIGSGLRRCGTVRGGVAIRPPM